MGDPRIRKGRKTLSLLVLWLFFSTISLGGAIAVTSGCGGGSGGPGSINSTSSLSSGTSSPGGTSRALTEPPQITYAKCYGGSSFEGARAILRTDDGGYVVAGTSGSTDGDLTGIIRPPYDYSISDGWLYKIDGNGAIVSQGCYGGLHGDNITSICKSSDGGYYFAGDTYSLNIPRYHGIPGTRWATDIWVGKINATGGLVWQECLGGYTWDYAHSVSPTADGGCIVVGYTYSNDGDVTDNHGGANPIPSDVWVVKLSSTGAIQWKKCLGGTSHDKGYSVCQTSDGGYVIAGTAGSNNGDISGNHPYTTEYGTFYRDDMWVVKLDSSGVLLWQKCLGGSGYESARSICQTSDGGYLVAGETDSNDGDVSGNHPYSSDEYGTYYSTDMWVVKLDNTEAHGNPPNIQWSKCLGGTMYETAYSIRETSDGGCFVAGTTTSNDGDVTGYHANSDPNWLTYDYWVAKLDNTGGLQWQKCLGGTNDEGQDVSVARNASIKDLGKRASSSSSDGNSVLDVSPAITIQQTSSGSYVIAGITSSNDGDVQGDNHGSGDAWVVKLGQDVPFSIENAKATPEEFTPGAKAPEGQTNITAQIVMQGSQFDSIEWQVTVTASDGAVVKTFDTRTGTAGSGPWDVKETWDGKNDARDFVPYCEYSFVIKATAVQGTEQIEAEGTGKVMVVPPKPKITEIKFVNSIEMVDDNEKKIDPIYFSVDKNGTTTQNSIAVAWDQIGSTSAGLSDMSSKDISSMTLSRASGTTTYMQITFELEVPPPKPVTYQFRSMSPEHGEIVLKDYPLTIDKNQIIKNSDITICLPQEVMRIDSLDWQYSDSTSSTDADWHTILSTNEEPVLVSLTLPLFRGKIRDKLKWISNYAAQGATNVNQIRKKSVAGVWRYLDESKYKYDAGKFHCTYDKSYRRTGSDPIDDIMGHYVQYIRRATFDFTGFMNEKFGDCEDASALYYICCILQGQEMYLCRFHNNDMTSSRNEIKLRPVFWFGRRSDLPYDNKMFVDTFHQFGFANGTVFDPTFKYEESGIGFPGFEDGYVCGSVPTDFIKIAVDPDPASIQRTDFKYDTFIIDEVK